MRSCCPFSHQKILLHLLTTTEQDREPVLVCCNFFCSLTICNQSISHTLCAALTCYELALPSPITTAFLKKIQISEDKSLPIIKNLLHIRLLSMFLKTIPVTLMMSRCCILQVRCWLYLLSVPLVDVLLHLYGLFVVADLSISCFLSAVHVLNVVFTFYFCAVLIRYVLSECVCLGPFRSTLTPLYDINLSILIFLYSWGHRHFIWFGLVYSGIEKYLPVNIWSNNLRKLSLPKTLMHFAFLFVSKQVQENPVDISKFSSLEFTRLLCCKMYYSFKNQGKSNILCKPLME